MIRRFALALLFAWPAAALGNPEVLTIEEAAQFLRVPAEKVLSLARGQRIPARELDGEWRLSRAALMEWLKGAGEPLSASELSAITGRGIAPLAQAAPAAVGEKPSAPTAEEVALREQGALLKGGMKTLELGLAYARSERETFPVARTEARLFSATLTGRYGIKNDLQATLRLPASYRHNNTQLSVPGSTSAETASSNDRYFGDLSLSLLGVAKREAMGRPNVIWTLDSVLPSGPGDSGLGTGLVLSKSYDPIVLFGGLSYMRGLSVDEGDPRRLLAKNTWRATLGYAYAINDSLALNGSLASTYRSALHSTVAGTVPAPRERHQLQLGMTWMLERGLFIEPSVAFAVGSASPDVTFSLNVPYTF